MNLNLSGKHALVCGATQGIGRAAAFELASLGAAVTLVARNEDTLRKTLTELPATDDQRHGFICADFTKPDALKETVTAYLQKNNSVHILVNNTGGPPAGPASDANNEQFVAAFSQHLLCNHILAQAVLPGMKSAGYGRIVNVISTSVKQPIKGLGVSNTVRAAVANWAKTLAGEVGAFGVTVNNVLPGPTATTRLKSLIEAQAAKSGESIEKVTAEWVKEIPLGRIGEASEVGAAIAFLASPAAAFITGINLPVDGGRTASL